MAEAARRISSIPVGFDVDGRPIRVRRRRRRGDDNLVDALLYPISDGPGVVLLALLPPILAVMTLPVIDVFLLIKTSNAFSPVHLLLLPVALPLVGAFVPAAGYVLLFYGRILAASAFGEDEQPGLPAWDPHEIAEGLGRWIWAALMGVALGLYPALLYWTNCGDVDLLDVFIFIDLAVVGLSYALMALAAALLHENIASANPLAVVAAIGRVGWDYVGPCVLACLGVASVVAAWRYVLFASPNLGVGVFGLWACWVWGLYQGIVIFRVLGLTYCKHADDLGWFRKPPRWGA